MAIKTQVTLPDGKAIKCECGNEILTVGKNMQLVIPSIHGKCFECGSTFIFDTLYMDDPKHE